MKDYKNIRISRIFSIVISAIMLMILMNGMVHAKTDTKSTGDSSNSNFSIQNVITAVKNFDQAGKKTDGGIDAKARNRKIKNAIFWICNCIFCVCFSISNMELYSKNYFRNGSKSLRNSFKLFYLNLI